MPCFFVFLYKYTAQNAFLGWFGERFGERFGEGFGE